MTTGADFNPSARPAFALQPGRIRAVLCCFRRVAIVQYSLRAARGAATGIRLAFEQQAYCIELRAIERYL